MSWGTETTVRLLSIDTPESKHLDRPVECLGAEATAFTKSLLAPGGMPSSCPATSPGRIFTGARWWGCARTGAW
ncbi:thermonuclease family protein [Arthrobacter sp. MYb227]|uniref:thermonuclease family protein n=1 Tax=Arthrobacter sp. MYb227 TaxID=1848601 RepID=UPI0035BE111F